MAKPKPNPEREEFHQRVARLHDHLQYADPQDLTDFDREVLDVLDQLRDALDKLALGDELEIFRPGPKNPRGSGTPSKIQQRRWRAVFYVEAIVRLHKVQPGEAIGQIAAAFGVPPDYLRTWRKPIINKNNNEANAVAARTQIADWLAVERTTMQMGWGKVEGVAGILARAQAEGEQLKPTQG